MARVDIESTRHPGRTKSVSSRDAAILVRLGGWQYAIGSDVPATTKKAPAPTGAVGPRAYDELVKRHGSIGAAPVRELEDLADAFGLNADAIEGTGANGNVRKADWVRALQRARGTYQTRDMRAR